MGEKKLDTHLFVSFQLQQRAMQVTLEIRNAQASNFCLFFHMSNKGYCWRGRIMVAMRLSSMIGFYLRRATNSPRDGPQYPRRQYALKILLEFGYEYS